MSTEQNKKIVCELFDRFSASDINGVLAMMTDDVTWLLPGKPESLPIAGLYSKEQLEKLFYTLLEGLKDGLKMKVKNAIAEGNMVAIEAESEGDLKNGRFYRQQYHFAIELRDGKICAVREYLDTQHAFNVWLAPK
ncbi:MAG: nuclear transport factor 2 family protein [Acidobacteria bacterium]|nr:nuclear transport factor 2 family protein [Acidobacteriota bacterium]